MGIDIVGEQCDIQHQAGYGYGCDLIPVDVQETHEFSKADGREFYKIVNDKAYDRSYQPKQQAKPEVVFF